MVDQDMGKFFFFCKICVDKYICIFVVGNLGFFVIDYLVIIFEYCMSFDCGYV